MKRPRKFDVNIVVIGGGSAGLVAAYIAVAVKARVTLIEKHKMGGDCLNTGCVPSKALIKSAQFIHDQNRAQEFGMKSAKVKFDFANIMERIQNVIATIEPHDSMERYSELGVDCIEGEAKITSPYTVEVNANTIATRNIIVAAGASPFIPPIPGIDQINYLTSDNLWDLRELPKRLVVLGGGPIGSELTQCFARLGSQVTQVEMLPQLLANEDSEVAEVVKEKLVAEGVDVRTKHLAKAVITKNTNKILVCEHEDSEVEIKFDKLLVAVGRKANLSGYGLEELGLIDNQSRVLEVNEFLQTKIPTIYACGDVAGPYQFTHTAAHQAWYASVNSLFGSFRRFKVDYGVIPWATFTDPEVARVGLSEKDAKAKSIPYEVTRYGIDDLDRAITDGEAHGFVKIITQPGKDKILGVTIVGTHASNLISEFISAMKYNLGLNKILGTIHIYPTMAEANKFAAGVWKREHAPQGLLKWVARYHAWRR